MREPLETATRTATVFTVALVLSACSDPWGDGSPFRPPVPESAADGIITDISSPQTVFPEAIRFHGLGSDGTVMVKYPEDPATWGEWTDGKTDGVGIALVEPNGRSLVVAEPGSALASTETGSSTSISESMAVFYVIGDEGDDWVFVNRRNGGVTRVAPVVQSGLHSGERLDARAPFVLFDDVVYFWTLTDEGFQLAATRSDGQAWFPFGIQDNPFFGIGWDGCARAPWYAIISTPDDDSMVLTSMHLDPDDLSGYDGSSVVSFSTLDGEVVPRPIGPFDRCGRTLIGKVYDPADNLEWQFGLFDEAGVTPLDFGEDLSPMEFTMNSDWIAAEGWRMYPKELSDEEAAIIEDLKRSAAEQGLDTEDLASIFASNYVSTGILMDRSSGEPVFSVENETCAGMEISGNYITWVASLPGADLAGAAPGLTCAIYVGVLTEPRS